MQSDQWPLTYDHDGEHVPVVEVPQYWLVPRFHADHGGDDVDDGDGLARHRESKYLVRKH